MRSLILATVFLLFAGACTSSGGSGEVEAATETTPETTATTSTSTTTSTTVAAGPFEISSPAFSDGQRVPIRFTCDGPDVSPPLQVTGIPEGTASLVLIVDDPDAPVGTWDHWVEYDIPAGPGELTIEEDAGVVGVQGINSWNLTGYGGPCPPPDEEHRYFFRVFALSSTLDIPAGADSEGVRDSMTGLILDEAELMGTYSR